MKGKNTIFFLIFILLIDIPIGYSASNEGYGEDQGALGQFVDSFENMDNITVSYNVIRNETTESMELEKSGFVIDWDNQIFVETFENFPTGWTVGTGGGGSITKSSTEVYEGSYSARVYAPSTGAYCYAYDNFATMNDDSLSVFYLFVNPSIQPDYEHVVGIYDTVAGGYVWEVRLEYHDSDYWIQNDIANSGTDVSTIATNEWVELVVYFNSTSNMIRYYINGVDKGEYGAKTPNGNGNRVYIGDTSGNWWKAYYYLDSLIIGEGSMGPGYGSDGYFITTDYLSNNLANGSALVQMTNTTMPENTAMTMELSDDNITWTLNDWQPIFGGFESVDLRDLNYSSSYYIRYNLSSTDPLVTPRIYQSRLITSIGNVTVGSIGVSGGINSSTILMLILLFIVVLLIYWGVKKK